MIDPPTLSEVPQRNAEAPPQRHVVGRAMLFAAVIAAAWVALTVRRPEVTYHLAPLIAAGSAPLATRQQSRPHRSRISLITGAVSTTLVLVVAAALTLTDHLEGPTIWHTRPAALEAMAMAIVGGVSGTWVAVRGRPGLLGRLSAEVVPSPAAKTVCGTLGQAAVTCQAVLHMDRQFGVPAAHRADGNVTAHTSPQIAVELTVDERVEVATVAEMIEVHHAGGNPTSTRILPAE